MHALGVVRYLHGILSLPGLFHEGVDGARELRKVLARPRDEQEREGLPVGSNLAQRGIHRMFWGGIELGVERYQAADVRPSLPDRKAELWPAPGKCPQGDALGSQAKILRPVAQVGEQVG